MHQKGAHIVAQDKESSVIFGMNREVIHNGHAGEVVALERIADALMERAGAKAYAGAGYEGERIWR
jgi:chemotaxis response regulator CheB